MPHYANGREAKPGDKALVLNTKELVVIESITPGSECCNAVVHPALASGNWQTVSQMIHAEDAGRIIGAALAAPPAGPAP